MTPHPPLEGSCFCGNVAYSILNPESSLTLSAYCHCTSCQRLNGAPFVWTTHWIRSAVVFHSPPSDPSESNPTNIVFAASLDTFESLPGRKFKLRCKKCGSPIGSYNVVKEEWTIWPTTLKRGEGGEIVRRERIAPTAHQFYGTALVKIEDNLSKWEGYEGKSRQL